MVGMAIPLRMIFWQQMKTRNVGIEAKTNAAIDMYGYPAYSTA